MSNGFSSVARYAFWTVSLEKCIIDDDKNNDDERLELELNQTDLKIDLSTEPVGTWKV